MEVAVHGGGRVVGGSWGCVVRVCKDIEHEDSVFMLAVTSANRA